MPSPGALGTGGRLHLRMALPGRSLGGGRGSLPDGVGKCQQIIRAWLLRRRGHGQTQDFPAPRNREGLGMLRTKIIGMWFRISGQRPQHCG